MLNKKVVFEVFRLGKTVKLHIFATDGKSAAGKIRNLKPEEAQRLWEIVDGD